MSIFTGSLAHTHSLWWSIDSRSKSSFLPINYVDSTHSTENNKKKNELRPITHVYIYGVENVKENKNKLKRCTSMILKWFWTWPKRDKMQELLKCSQHLDYVETVRWDSFKTTTTKKTTQNKISHLISSNVSYLTFYVVDFFHRNSNLKLELLNPHKEEDEKKHQKSIQSAYGD